MSKGVNTEADEFAADIARRMLCGCPLEELLPLFYNAKKSNRQYFCRIIKHIQNLGNDR